MLAYVLAELGQYVRERLNPLVARIRLMDKPVVASINGVVAGGSVGMALMCDMRIAAESASFINAFINIGLVPDLGCTLMLPRLVGYARAMELACTGRKVEVDEALQMGLVNHVVRDELLRAATQDFAQKLAELPTRAIGLTKRALSAGWTGDLASQLELEAALQSEAARTHDHREGIAAFLEKRSPQFKGC